MAIAFSAVGSAGASSGDATQVDVPVAGTPAAGNLLVIHVATQTGAPGAVWNTPSGWTQIDVQRSLSAAFYKIATGGETTVTVTRNGFAQKCLGRMMLFTGGTLTLDASGSAASLTVSTMTPTKENTLWVWLASREDNVGDFSAYAMATDDPGSWTERYEQDEASQMTIAGATSALRPQTTGTGNCTATGSGGTQAGFVFAIGNVENASPAPAALTLASTVNAAGITTTSNVPVSAITLTAAQPAPTPSTQEFASFSNTSKHAATATNTAKNNATVANTAKHDATVTNTQKTQ